MQTSSGHMIVIVVVISTFLILFFAVVIVRYILLYQKRRYRHQREILELRESYSQTLMESKLKIQEDTLKHIAEELHANASHQASLINIHLSAILEKGTPEMKNSIYEIKLLAKQLMGDLKALSAGLNTNHIMKIGFTSALENELNRVGKVKKFVTHFNKTGDEFRLRTDHEIILFRMCQEMLNNILKYSKASAVTVSLNYEQDVFRLEIGDDGVGFDVQEVLHGKPDKISTGIMNMHSRAKLIHASLEINSSADHGTQFVVVIPAQLPTQ